MSAITMRLELNLGQKKRIKSFIGEMIDYLCDEINELESTDKTAHYKAVVDDLDKTFQMLETEIQEEIN